MAASLIAAFLVLRSLPEILATNLLDLYQRDLALRPRLSSATQLELHRLGLQWAQNLLRTIPPDEPGEAKALLVASAAAYDLQRLQVDDQILDCTWHPQSCEQNSGRFRLSAEGRERLLSALAHGDLNASNRLEWEVLAYNCLLLAQAPGATPLGQSCAAKIAEGWPSLAHAVLKQDVYVAASVPELTTETSRELGSLLRTNQVTCSQALDFFRNWVNASGFLADQLASTEAANVYCPDSVELQFYYARAADLAGRAAEARRTYANVQDGLHPEPAFWRIDFLARQGACAEAASRVLEFVRIWPGAAAGLNYSLAWRSCRSGLPESEVAATSVLDCGSVPLVFEAEDLPGRTPGGTDLASTATVSDPAAANGLARQSRAFGTVAVFGPYVSLPLGLYRVTFWVRSDGSGPNGKVARLEVRSDYASWRLYDWSSELSPTQSVGNIYQAVSNTFLHTGEGAISVTVLALMNNSVLIDRIEFLNVSCE